MMTAPVTSESSLITPTAADVVPVQEGIRSLGDAVQMVLNVPRSVDPNIYCVYVHLSDDSVPHGIIRGLVTLQQLARVDVNKADWMAAEIYECPKDGCTGILTDDLRQGLYWLCPKCGDLATVDPELVPESGRYEQLPVRQTWKKFYAFAARTWGDVLAEYVNRIWNMRKVKDGSGYQAMVLVRRPRAFLQALSRQFLETPSAVNESKLVGGRSTQQAAGPEYSLYTPESIAKDLESGSSLATRLAVFIGGA